MMQVADRRSQAGPSASPTAILPVTSRSQAGPSASPTAILPVTSPLVSPKKASSLPQSPRIGATDPKAPNPLKSSLWSSSGADEAAEARIQQFIIDTKKNPILFQLSESPVSAEVPYPPINDSNLAAHKKGSTSIPSALNQISPPATPNKQSELSISSDRGEGSSKSGSAPTPARDLFRPRVSLHPPRDVKERGAGMVNKGNTCYMNSTLQALLHLPPLLHALLTHEDRELYGRMGARPEHKFDAIGEMVSLAQSSFSKSGSASSIAPSAFLNNLKLYARPLNKFRQEDAHEFLRFLLDAMQACSLLRAPKSLKPNDPLRETTLIHKIFGGKLRSRVQCQRCKHNSDTFDPILDLSLDLRKSDSLHEALDKFTSVDVLTGSEKYKCERCKKAVEATKGFTIHETPAVLTIHLKRFTIHGNKIGRRIHYPETLLLPRNVLSEGIAPQRYKLRSVVQHHGSGPNSGHYVASIKGTTTNGRWYEMNDSYVSPLRDSPTNAADAYLLFYVKDASSALNEAVRSGSTDSNKRKFSHFDVDERRSKKRELRGNIATPPSSLLKRKPMSSTPSTEGKGTSDAISPASFYGSSPLSQSSQRSLATGSSSPISNPLKSQVNRKESMFRNVNFGDDEDDIGEAVETSSSRRPFSNLPSLPSKKRNKHRDTLGLNIRPGNQKQRLPSSPFPVGRNSLDKPVHSRMKDRHGNRV